MEEPSILSDDAHYHFNIATDFLSQLLLAPAKPFLLALRYRPLLTIFIFLLFSIAFFVRPFVSYYNIFMSNIDEFLTSCVVVVGSDVCDALTWCISQSSLENVTALQVDNNRFPISTETENQSRVAITETNPECSQEKRILRLKRHLRSMFKRDTILVDRDIVARKQPTNFQLMPAFGKTFRLEHSAISLKVLRKESLVANGHKEQSFQLQCFGLSTKPIQDFLESVVKQYNKSQNVSTQCRHPKTLWKILNGECWFSTPIRPRRLNSVFLPRETKENLVKDIEHFLAPGRRKWYEDRGFAYRRGYLFHGPPGSGKSSLARALANEFQLPLYVITSFTDLDNQGLSNLFTDLPERVIVLLEDIDCAGIAGIDRSPSSMEEQTTEVTLAGLFNAIDGMVATENRILIITTNYPDKLDLALKRPGRIDYKVAFANASKLEARELFQHFFPSCKKDLVENFVQLIDDGKFSIAELSNFLIGQGNPAQACQKFVEFYGKKQPHEEKKEEMEPDICASRVASRHQLNFIQ